MNSKKIIFLFFCFFAGVNVTSFAMEQKTKESLEVKSFPEKVADNFMATLNNLKETCVGYVCLAGEYYKKNKEGGLFVKMNLLEKQAIGEAIDILKQMPTNHPLAVQTARIGMLGTIISYIADRNGVFKLRNGLVTTCGLVFLNAVHYTYSANETKNTQNQDQKTEEAGSTNKISTNDNNTGPNTTLSSTNNQDQTTKNSTSTNPENNNEESIQDLEIKSEINDNDQKLKFNNKISDKLEKISNKIDFSMSSKPKEKDIKAKRDEELKKVMLLKISRSSSNLGEEKESKK